MMPVLRRVEYTGHHGLRLVGDELGEPGRPPVVLLHGGGQTRHAWGRTARALADAGYHTVALDLRGHGESAWSPNGRYELDDFAGDLLAVLDRFDRPPAVVGASLGGLATLIAEGEAPTPRLGAVILVDIAHRLELAGVMRILAFMTARAVDGFGSLDEVADAIAQFVPHRRRPEDLSGLAKNLRLGDDGRYRWHWDPKFLGPHIDPAAAADRLRAAVRALRVPTLLVRGALSDVLSDETAREFQELAPHAEYVDVAAAAHMIAGDRNDAFSDAVIEFLRRTCAA